MEGIEERQGKRSNRKIFYMELLGNTCFNASLSIEFGRLLSNFRLNTSFMFISDT